MADLKFIDQVFFHTDPTGMVVWNAKLRHGWTESVSSSNRRGEFEATTMYAALNAQPEKEAAWERVRENEFPDKPTRVKALFLFTSREDVDWALANWFAGQDRDVIAVLVPTTSKLHIADATHLDCVREKWEEGARRYWSGELTGSPRLEAVLDGTAYIPNTHEMTPKLRPFVG